MITFSVSHFSGALSEGFMQIHAEIRPHLRRLRKVISASQRLSNSRQTPLEMQTKCFSPYSYVCDRFGGSPSLISCTKGFSFIMQVEMAKKAWSITKWLLCGKQDDTTLPWEGYRVDLLSWVLSFSCLVEKRSYCLQSPIFLAAFHCDLRSSINTLFGVWCLRVCAANDAPFVLGCAASTKSDLLREVFVVYAVMDEGRFHPRHCN